MQPKPYAITVSGALSERFATVFERTRIEPPTGAQTRLLSEPFD